MTGSLFSPLVGFDDIRRQAIDDWQQYRLHGGQYLALAERAHASRNRIFTPEILYNLITMAIEKMVMGALMRIGRLPDNHTMHDLVAALEQWLPLALAGDLAEGLRRLDAYQDICDPYAGSFTPPTATEIEAMLAIARRLEEQLAASNL